MRQFKSDVVCEYRYSRVREAGVAWLASGENQNDSDRSLSAVLTITVCSLLSLEIRITWEELKEKQ